MPTKKRSFIQKKKRNYRKRAKKYFRKAVRPKVQYDAPAKFTYNAIVPVQIRSPAFGNVANASFPTATGFVQAAIFHNK